MLGTLGNYALGTLDKILLAFKLHFPIFLLSTDSLSSTRNSVQPTPQLQTPVTQS